MLYTIEDTTLTGLAEAIREKTVGYEENYYLKREIILKTNEDKYDCVDIEPITFDNFSPKCAKIKIVVNAISDYSYGIKWMLRLYNNGSTYNYTIPFGTVFPYEIILSIDEYFNEYRLIYIDGGRHNYHSAVPAREMKSSTFDIEVIGLDEEGNEFKYTPLEMIDEINGLNVLPDEGLTITGDCGYRFANNSWNWFIDSFGDKITTKDITNCGYMFHSIGDTLKEIPFDINCKKNSTINLLYMFDGYWHLSRAPKINKCKPYQMSNMFDGCRMLNSFPDDFASDWDWSYLTGLTSSYLGNMNDMFNSCSILRKLPMNLIKYGNPNIYHYYNLYYNMCYCCYNLDEIIGLPFPHYKANWTSNAFNRTFDYCHRLKDMTFEVNEDGAPKIMTWKNQIIDLSVEVGYVPSGDTDISYMTKDETITDANKVIDDATYQALKDDPNWWTTDLNHSRYNRTSAVNTINSLPDTSAYLATNGGTNTIKFRGAQGVLTDGGAINTMTEEEIAVATAKGWTVSLV